MQETKINILTKINYISKPWNTYSYSLSQFLRKNVKKLYTLPNYQSIMVSVAMFFSEKGYR